MAITYVVALGYPFTMVQNQVYSLPACNVTLLATAALEHSADGSTFSALTNSNTTGATTGGGFIRCTTAAPVLSCKRD